MQTGAWKEILFFRTLLSLDAGDKAAAIEGGGDRCIGRLVQFDCVVREELIGSKCSLEVCVEVLVRASAIVQHVNVVRPVLPSNPDAIHRDQWRGSTVSTFNQVLNLLFYIHIVILVCLAGNREKIFIFRRSAQ